MNIDVAFTPDEVTPSDLVHSVVVVIDVLRATSTIVEALANGARMVVPVPGTDEAVRIAQNIGRGDVLLCGERRSRPIEGFDLGNSPREFTADRVGGKTLVMTTTNGTPALALSASARRTLIASFLNLDAVADAIVADGGPAVIMGAGRERRFALEDAVCAGALVNRVSSRLAEPPTLNDTAIAAARLAEAEEADLVDLLRNTAAGRQLIDAELGDDIPFCAMVNRHAIVPELHDRQITL